MADVDKPTPAGRRPRITGIRQSDVARAIRGALQGGMDVREVIATPSGVRILSTSSAYHPPALNEWDEVFADG